ncbi:MAG: glycerol-3-phosphate 1-O-acyltransferase PlsY [Gammaproteobacteria bacterium]
MLTLIFLIFLTVAAYFIGSLSSGVLVCRYMKLPDPRTEGSKNPGATNVMRVGGRNAAILTLVGDMLKGFIPVGLVMLMGFNYLIVAFVIIGVVVGHIFPYFFEFRGGKGVATSFGALLAVSFWLALVALAAWVVTFFITRISSLSALIAMGIVAVIGWAVVPFTIYLAILVCAGLLVWRHWGNIERLKKGEEAKFKSEKTTTSDSEND